jgi:endogenous inhibitor of DNA gyrase (YacG/DUF329 family)
MSACLKCGKNVKPPRKNKIQKYCSKACALVVLHANGNGKPIRPLITKNCQHCGISISFKQYAGRSEKQFCSVKCNNRSRIKKITIISEKCLKCGKAFEKPENKKDKKYCSRSCSTSAFRSGRYTTPEIVKKECKHCRVIFSLDREAQRNRRQFCSIKCNNQSRTKNGPATCLNCKVEYKARGKGKKYCSRDCYVTCKNKELLDRSIDLLGQGKLNDRRVVKKTMVAIGIDYVCTGCSISSWQEKPLTLILDHINGDSSNNSLDNLRFVCPNCDSQSTYFKGRNYGRGRTALKKTT